MELEIAAAGKKIFMKVVLAPLLVLIGASTAFAGDSATSDEDPAAFLELSTQLHFSSPLEAYRQGKTAYDEGWYGLALPALRFAAKRRVFGARLKLARMYERGLGVPRDSAAAFDLYKSISEKHWNIPSIHPAAPYIGQALASLGLYYLNGITEIGVKPDVKRAATYFTHSAQFFGSPRAQYQLAKLYLSGQGVKKNVRRAIAWLNNATKKKHAPSQALLGQLLWQGELVTKRQIKALALLTMAQQNAGPEDREWISELHESIVAASDLKTREGAKTAVARWVRIYSPRVRTKRFVVRKKMRRGSAGSTLRVKRVIKSGKVLDAEQRQWMGLGSFQEIDAK